MTHYVLLHIYETCIDAPGTLPLPITHLEPGHLKGVLQSKHLKLVSDFLVRNPDAIRFRLDSFKDDFMYQGFSPCEDYTVDFVFRGHPRLTLVAEGEWISWHAFHRRLKVAPFKAKMALVDPTRMERYLEAGAITQEVELEKAIASDTLQKKVTPWESMIDASMLGLERNEHIQTQKSEGLIVFASMIEKLPNLGGLARTSEIFGAERIVLPNLNVLQSQEFKSGAVSAEKWVPVEECSERDMIEYLKLKKEQGYTLVALEQTSSSVNLHSYKFPQKTVLVLGAEGLGVPANVLILMDDCVEIEQVGVTRSLNVHVSAAIAICEWRRQSTRVATWKQPSQVTIWVFVQVKYHSCTLNKAYSNVNCRHINKYFSIPPNHFDPNHMHLSQAFLQSNQALKTSIKWFKRMWRHAEGVRQCGAEYLPGRSRQFSSGSPP